MNDKGRYHSYYRNIRVGNFLLVAPEKECRSLCSITHEKHVWAFLCHLWDYRTPYKCPLSFSYFLFACSIKNWAKASSNGKFASGSKYAKAPC